MAFTCPQRVLTKIKSTLFLHRQQQKKQPILKHKNNIYYDNNRVQHQPDRSSKKS